MKIFLDDARDPSVVKFVREFSYLKSGDWAWAKNFKDFEVLVAVACSGEGLEEISLDHDLGFNSKDGYEALKLIEKRVFTQGMPLPTIHIHTANPAARQKMELVVANLKNRCE